MAKESAIKILNKQGEAVKDFTLPADLAKLVIKPGLVHQVVVAYAANRRAGTAHTKTRDEVSGGGKKPWRQKGTGRARHGSIRSPIWVGGGVVFGPRSTRNYEQSLSQELKHQAKAMVVVDYLNSQKVLAVESLPETTKTKEFASLLKDLKIYNRRTLVLLTKAEQPLRRAITNIKGVEVMAVKEFNAYDGLRYPRWLISEAGLNELTKLIA